MIVVSSLADQLCGPVYSATPTLGAAVSAAIASATSEAAAEATKDVTDINNYPACGVSIPLLALASNTPGIWWTKAN